MNPIGYLKSPFLFKNGTPRQPTVCKEARGMITIEKSVFNNPEHSLEGLKEFTHVWILFIFHQNNNSYTKAKVKPPRLNGKRVGLFSTRSPYRPNNVGLTLAKIEHIQGATLTVSGIDMIDGTPVIDIKPYIAQYDCPVGAVRGVPADVNYKSEDDHTDAQTGDVEDHKHDIVYFCREERMNENTVPEAKGDNCNLSQKLNDNESELCPFDGSGDNSNITRDSDALQEKLGGESRNVFDKGHVDNITCDTNKSPINTSTHQKLDVGNMDFSHGTSADCDEAVDSIIDIQHSCKQGAISKSAEWIEKPPISSLTVRFTPTAFKQLQDFKLDSDNEIFKLRLLKNCEKAKSAIVNILQEDPRSTYRRKHCEDSLYYFTIDVIHVTCWFDDDTTTAEVVRVKPACLVEQCKQRYK